MLYRRRGHIHKICGCPRAKWLRCRHSFHFAFQHLGVPYRFSLTKQAGKPSDYVMLKSEAETLADEYRHQIRNGTFRAVPVPARLADVGPDTRLTFGDVADRYLKEFVPFDHKRGTARREGGRKLMEWYVKGLKRVEIPAANGTLVALESKPLADLTTADIEAVRAGWPVKANAPKGGIEGPRRALRRLRHLFNWSIEQGIADSSPFLRAGKVVVHIPKGGERDRRLEDGEDERLLAHASASDPWLYALIIVLLETGCRVGEILSLTWGDVKWGRNVLLVREETAKDAEPRDVPMTAPVKAVLDMRHTGPDGSDWPATARVFGNSVGEPVRTARPAWERLCAAVKITGLHLHDLRREFACRLRESGAPDHEVAAWLGHANISTTSVYLKTNRLTLQNAAKRFEHKRKLCKAIVRTLAEQASVAAELKAKNAGKSLN